MSHPRQVPGELALLGARTVAGIPLGALFALDDAWNRGVIHADEELKDEVRCACHEQLRATPTA